MHHLLHTTLVQTVFSVTGSLIGALILLAVVHKVQKNQANLIMMILSSIMIFSGTVVALVMRQLFGFTGLPGIIIANMVLNVPLAFFILYERWSLIDPVLVLLARDAGASWAQVARDVYLPWLKPALFQASVLITFFCALSVSIPCVMGGNWHTLSSFFFQNTRGSQPIILGSDCLLLVRLCRNSVLLAGISATATVLIACLCACWARCAQRMRIFMHLLCYTPFFIGSVLTGSIVACRCAGIHEFVVSSIILAMVNVPVAYGLILAQMNAYHADYTHTAQMLGATYCQAVRTVLLPFIGSAIVRAWIIVFGYALNEVGAVSVLKASAWPTLGLAMRDALKAGRFDTALFFCCLMIVISLVTYLLASVIKRSFFTLRALLV